MIRELREAFNASFTEERYADFVARLTSRVGVPIEFPVSETPCFFPRPLMDALARAGEELTRQAMTGDAGAAAERIVPERFRAPNMDAKPTFIQVDFGGGPKSRIQNGRSGCCFGHTMSSVLPSNSSPFFIT